LLPLLKRDAFEQAVYGLVEAGVNDIQPVITEKTNCKWGGGAERAGALAAHYDIRCRAIKMLSVCAASRAKTTH